MSLFQVILTKKITFRRMNNKNIKGYNVYALYPDETYTSGIREVLLDTFSNPSEPNVERTEIELPFNENYTWQIPKDLFTDRDHKFRIYIDDVILSTLYYQYNKYNRMITIDKNLKPLDINNKITLKYFKDMITRTYIVEKDCELVVKPIFSDTYTYGTHNVII